MKDGGPAFPTISEELVRKMLPAEKISQGMTLRDYFAAKAMQGYISRSTYSNGGFTSLDELCKGAYRISDAMLREMEGDKT